jgi:16S rRNA (guanine527-N7)-methyltransferase
MTAATDVSDFFTRIESSYLLSDDQKDRFRVFIELLSSWNKKVNLVSRREKDLMDRHLLNSLAIAYFHPFAPAERVADIGSGGGFPAIPLAIICRGTHFTLIERVRKKSAFLEIVLRETALDNATVVRAEVESLGEDHRAAYHAVTARAVAPVSRLIQLSRPLLRTDGVMLFLKGKNCPDEVAGVKAGLVTIEAHPLRECGWFNSPQDGHLLVCRKTHR